MEQQEHYGEVKTEIEFDIHLVLMTEGYQLHVEATWSDEDGVEHSDHWASWVESPEEGLRLAVAWLEENVDVRLAREAHDAR